MRGGPGASGASREMTKQRSVRGEGRRRRRAAGRSGSSWCSRWTRIGAPVLLDALAQLGEEGGRDDFGATATAALGSDPDRERGERGMKGERGSVLGFARGREGNLIRAGRRRMAATAAWCGHGRGISATTLGEQEEGERGPRWVGSAPVASWAKVHSSFWPFVFSFFCFSFSSSFLHLLSATNDFAKICHWLNKFKEILCTATKSLEEV